MDCSNNVNKTFQDSLARMLGWTCVFAEVCAAKTKSYYCFLWLILYLLLLTVVWRHIPPRSLRKNADKWCIKLSSFPLVTACSGFNAWSLYMLMSTNSRCVETTWTRLIYDDQYDKHMSEYIEDTQDGWLLLHSIKIFIFVFLRLKFKVLQ